MAARRHCPHRLLYLGVALLFVGTLWLAAHDSVSARQTRAVMPTLRLDYYSYGGPGLAGSLDPVHISDPFDYELSSLLINANLVHILPDDTVMPDLATWKISKNQLVYTFVIARTVARPGSRGHRALRCSPATSCMSCKSCGGATSPVS